MSKSLTLNNNIKELNLNKNSEIINTNAIQLGDGVDYYNKYRFEYCWGKELSVQYLADSNFAINVTTLEQICANSLKTNVQQLVVTSPYIYPFKVTYGDTIQVDVDLLSYGGEVTTNTKNSSGIAYNVRLKGKGTDWEGQIFEDTILTPIEWKCNYKVIEFTGESSGTYPNYTYDVSYLKNDAAYEINRPVTGYYLHMFPLGDVDSIGITSQDDIIAFRIDDGNLSSSTASIFLYLRDKLNSNILTNNDWIRSGFDNSSKPEDHSCLIYQDSKSPEDVYFNTTVSSKDILLQFGCNGWIYDPETSGSHLINYSGISIGEDNKLYLNIVSDKNFRSTYGEKIAFAGRVVIYYGREDYIPTYGFTTFQSVLCRTNLGTPIGSYQYLGTSVELNAMTILSNNGIIGVSKIVEIKVISTEALSPTVLTTAGINMTGENTFKIYASASESTGVTVTYEIRYQK